ncbi:MAG TPA: TonB-dependent receptor plug domain-containing protein [Opitutaceae bacterium]|nr:TonB-dependent receptor plug domain-containing protein [Opitutaceae bacterium]
MVHQIVRFPRCLRRWLIIGLSPSLLLAQTAPAPSSEGNSSANSDEVFALPEFTVETTARRDDYIASEATSGTRTGAQIIDLPYNVQVLTREFLQDFQLFDVEQQLMFASNYGPRDREYGVVTGNRLRGFEPVILRDGFSRAGPPDLSNANQVEIIMGPQSTLYGQASPGGLINYISKRPRHNPAYRLSTVWGSYEFQRHDLEATGPVYKDKLFYLFTGGYSYNRTELDYVFQRLAAYTFSLSYKLSPNTTITGYWEQQKQKQNRGTGLPGLLVGSRPSASNPLIRSGGVVTSSYLPLAHFNQMGPNDHLDRNYDGANVLIEHRFNSAWSGRVNLQKFWKDFEQKRWSSGLNYVPETGRLTSRTPFREIQDDRATAVQADLLGRFTTGSFKHSLLFAGDYSHEVYSDDQFQLSTADVNALPSSVRFLDPTNPDWTPADYSKVTRATALSRREFTNTGLLASYRLTFWNDRLATMASVRHSEVESKVRNDATTAKPGDGTDKANTYSTGFNLKLAGDSLLLFANYSTSFDPQVLVDQGTGQVQRPEKGKGPEAGFKGIFFDQRVSYTVSLYEITKDNISTPNPDYDASTSAPGVPQYLGQGQNRVRGVDFSASARLTDDLTLLGSFGYLDSEITKSPDAPQNLGDVLTLVPDMTASGAVRYTFSHGFLKGLRIGANATYTGRTVINAATATRAREEHGPVQLYGGFVAYSWKTGHFRHTLSANVLNVFDKFYLNSNDKIGRGREIRGSYVLSF